MSSISIALFLLSRIIKWIFHEPFQSAPQFVDFIKEEQLCSGQWPGAQSLGKERNGMGSEARKLSNPGVRELTGTRAF